MRTTTSFRLGLLVLVSTALGCDSSSIPIDPPAPDASAVDASGTTPPPPSPDDGGVWAPPDAGPPPAGTLSIATWNLEDFPRHPDTIDRVARLVESLSFDLIGIQEITEPEPFEALGDAMPQHDMVVSFDSRTFTRVGFLYRPDRIAVGEVDRLFTSDRWAFPRSPLYAQLSVLDVDGSVVFDFAFVVVHLKAMPDEESRQRRIAAIEQLDAWVRMRVATEPDVIIVGDYNDELTDPPEENVFGPFLGAPDLYRMLTLETEQAGAYSYIPFRAMLDHVLVTADALAEYGTGHTEVLDVEADIGMSLYRDVVSDHRPVVARFALE